MLTLNRIRFANAGPFHSFDQELPPGAIGVFGPNGRGKTSLIRLIYCGLTNDFKGWPGGKERATRDGTDKDDPSFIFIDFTASGCRYELTRQLRSSSVTLKPMDGGKTLKTLGDVSERLEKLGITPRKLKASVFLEKPSNVFSLTEGELATLFGDLCGVSAVAKAGETLGKLISGDPRFMAPALQEDVPGDVQGAADALAAAEAEMADAERHIIPDAEADKIARAISLYDSALSAATRRKDAEKRLTDAQLVKDELELSVARLTAEHGAAVTAMQRAAAAAEPARAALLAAETAKKTMETRRRAEAELKTPPPKSPLKPMNEESCRHLVSDVESEAEYRTLTTQIDAAKKKNAVKVCPTCQQSLPDMTTFVDGLEYRRDGLKGQVDQIVGARATLQIYDAAVLAYKRDVQEYNRKIATAKQTLADLPNVQATAGADAESWQKAVKLAEQLTAATTKAAGALKEPTELLRKATMSVDRITAELEGIQTTNAVAVTPAIRKKLEDHREAVPRYAGAKASKLAAESWVVRANNRLEKYNEDLAQVRRVERRLAITRQIQQTFHRTALGAKVAGQFTTNLQSRLTEHLRYMGNPYDLKITADLKMDVFFKDGFVRPVSAFSDGQKGVAAIAFWTAVARVFSTGGAGFLVLDEPTANLDAANVRKLRDALAKFVESTRGQQQLLIVSHADDLRPVFDKVIDLGVMEI